MHGERRTREKGVVGRGLCDPDSPSWIKCHSQSCLENRLLVTQSCDSPGFLPLIVLRALGTSKPGQ